MKILKNVPTLGTRDSLLIFSTNILLIAVLIMMAALSASGQQTSVTPSENAPFPVIRDKVSQYWNNNVVTKGSGYKPYKRWEWFWEQRTGPDGVFPPDDIVVREWKKYAKSQGTERLTDNNSWWVPMGPFTTESGYFGLGRINCIAFHPTDPNTFWVGTPSGGLWKTTDFGATWTTNYDTEPVLGISDIVIDPNNPEIMYIATGDGDGGSLVGLNFVPGGDTKSIGILHSTDGGHSWNPTGFSYQVGQKKRTYRLLMSPVNSSTLYTATSDGIYATYDQGENWTLLIPGVFRDITFNTADPSVIYAATRYSDAGSGQIFRTIDGGTSWEQVTEFTDAVRIKMAVTPQDPSLLEAVTVNLYGGLGGIYRSTDAGASFSPFFTAGDDCSKNLLHTYPDPENHPGSCNGQGPYDLCYVIDPQHIQIRWIGGINTWASEDGGENWDLMNFWTPEIPGIPAVHADKHWFAFHPLQPETFMEANDGGIYYTKDYGATWTDISQGLQIGQIYRIGSSWSETDLVVAGFQDNGSQVDSSGFWRAPEAIGGDGMDCMIDYVDPQVKYASYAFGTLFRTTDHAWNNTVVISDSIPGRPTGSWVTPFILHPSQPEILYAGYRNIYKTTDRGDSWSCISALPMPEYPPDSQLLCLAVSPSNPKVMYASTRYELYRTTDEWKTFTSIKTGLPVDSAIITMIAVHAENPDNLWVTFSGYHEGIKVYLSGDGGEHWTNISGSLPNLPVNCIKFQDNARNALYVGTDVGVWFKNDNLPDWEYFSTGLPNVVVTDLDIQYPDGTILAATYGRGLWKSNLYVAPGTVQVNAIAIPANRGTVTGGGVYDPGQAVTLVAMPAEGWMFLGWFDGETLVSDSAVYHFSATESVNFTGIFTRATGVGSVDNSHISLIPNPVNKLLSVSMDLNLRKELSFYTLNKLNGETLSRFAPETGTGPLTIDFSGFSAGTYLVSFYFHHGERKTYKVIVQR